jgi:hypothetical protein
MWITRKDVLDETTRKNLLGHLVHGFKDKSRDIQRHCLDWWNRHVLVDVPVSRLEQCCVDLLGPETSGPNRHDHWLGCTAW